jgi:hypothetical protein
MLDPDWVHTDGVDMGGVHIGLDGMSLNGDIKSIWAIILFSYSFHTVMEAQIRSELAAYDRTCRATMAIRNGPLIAPVLQLSETALTALFAPAAYENLVTRPLKSKHIQCERKA